MKIWIVLIALVSVNKPSMEFMFQDPEVIKIAKTFCRSTNKFFYFKNDQTLENKAKIELSKIFDYTEGSYFVSAGVKTILIQTKNPQKKAIDNALAYFNKKEEYSIVQKGQAQIIIENAKTVFRFYPYKTTIIFEMF